MASDVVIEIFGKVTNPEAIHALAFEASEEASVDWSVAVEQATFIELVNEAAATERALMLTRKDTNNLFEGVTAACQEAGLAYVVTSGPTGEDFYTDGFSWAPGMDEEFHYELANSEPAIKIKDIRSQLAKGMPEFEKFIATIEASCKVGKIELEPGFADAYAAYVEAPGRRAP